MGDLGRGEILGPFLIIGAMCWLSVTYSRLWFLSLMAALLLLTIYEVQ